MRAAGICILSLFLFYSCQPPNETYTGKHIELDYSKVKELKDNSWIKIDDWKFRHIRDQKKAEQIQFSLPTTTVVLDSSNAGRAYHTQINPNNIPLYLSRYLSIINSADSLGGSSEARYRITDQAFASATGKLRISKSDSGTVHITTPAKYPAVIKVIDP